MKKPGYIKQALLKVTFVAALFLMVSCENQKSNDSKEVAEEHNDAKFDNSKQENDAQFLVKAGEISLEEIQLGKLAQQRGETADVKKLGKMMEDAHTKSLNDLRTLAKSKMMTIPTSPTDDAQDAYRELNEESGSDFDKAYTDMMVSEHKDAIAAFEDASEDSNDQDIKNWAKASLADLRSHLDRSMDCQRKSDNMSKK